MCRQLIIMQFKIMCFIFQNPDKIIPSFTPAFALVSSVIEDYYRYLDDNNNDHNYNGIEE